MLADQRKQLTAMLTALSELGKVGTRVINASQGRHGRQPQALQPILTKLAEAGDNLPKALEMAVTYPFPAAATGAVHGDYTNLRITADLDLRSIIGNLKPSGGPRPADLACPRCRGCRHGPAPAHRAAHVVLRCRRCPPGSVPGPTGLPRCRSRAAGSTSGIAGRQSSGPPAGRLRHEPRLA